MPLAAHLVAGREDGRVEPGLGRTRGRGKSSRAPAQGCRLVVTAHLDEIALMVTGIGHDGKIGVGPLGGVHPWKCRKKKITLHY